MTPTDLDALIERLNQITRTETWTSATSLSEEAAAAITELRDTSALAVAGWNQAKERAEHAEAELARARYQLRWRAEDTGATHYEGCWRDHYGCAMERIKALEGEQK